MGCVSFGCRANPDIKVPATGSYFRVFKIQSSADDSHENETQTSQNNKPGKPQEYADHVRENTRKDSQKKGGQT